MKNTMTLFGMGLAVLVISSTALAQETKVSKEAKQTRHIKMTKIENGKKMELDTVLTNDDVFVWNGDTISPVKHIKKFKHAGFDKMQNFDVTVENKDGKEKVMILRHKGGKPGEPMMWHMDSDNDDMEILTEDIDSLGKRVVVRKIAKDGKGNHMMFFNHDDMNHFPPVPPVPPVPHIKMLRSAKAGNAIHLDDPNIISFKKKDLSGDREKIEIVRKKSKSQEHFNFEFEGMPAPPPPPAIMHEFDNQGDKIIRKELKIEKKAEKATDQETKENK